MYKITHGNGYCIAREEQQLKSPSVGDSLNEWDTKQLVGRM